MARFTPMTGAGYLAKGLKMLPEPGIRRFVIIPLLINLLIFAGAIYLLISNFSGWVQYLIDLWLPDWDWLSFLEYLLWPFLAVLVIIAVYYGFSILANFIAAPFNGFLAEKIEMRERGAINSEQGFNAVVKMIPQSLARELQKLAYYLPRFLLLLVLSFVPVINLAMPLVWFLFAAWMMSIQYVDYPMDNNRVSFKQMRQLLKQNRPGVLGFGALVQLTMLVPLVNLIMMPAAVIGATLMWIDQYAPPVDSEQKFEPPSEVDRLPEQH